MDVGGRHGQRAEFSGVGGGVAGSGPPADDCGGTARASHDKADRSIGANAMRALLALGLLVAVCASANAAKVHHAKPRHVTARPSVPVDPRFPPVLQDQTPRYDDPSKFGGG